MAPAATRRIYDLNLRRLSQIGGDVQSNPSQSVRIPAGGISNYAVAYDHLDSRISGIVAAAYQEFNSAAATRILPSAPT